MWSNPTNKRVSSRSRSVVLTLCVLLGLMWCLPTAAKEDAPLALKAVGVEENIGAKVPMDLTFYNLDGESVALKDVIQGKPVVLSLIYYSCPMLCNLVATGLSNSLETLPMLAGKDFQSISISIDPEDTTETAKKFHDKHVSHLKELKPETEWAFLIDQNNHVKSLADALGYTYNFDPQTGEYAHTATLFILSPDGTISRYLYGIEYPSFNLRMSLIEAAENKTHSTVERVLLFCYNYDPNSGGYVLYAVNLMKIAGSITVLAILTMFIVLKRKERK